MSIKIGFIGAGNMGGALAKAAAAGGAKVLLADRDSDKAAALAAELGGKVCSNGEVVRKADYVFLAVKPQQYADVLGELTADFAAREGDFTVVSMAAGITTGRVRALIGGDCPVVRIMPNLPVSVGEGMVLYCTAGVDDGALDKLLQVMSCSGRWEPIDEQLIDAGSALSGCGPAFVYLFIDALKKGGVACGLSDEQAAVFAAQTVMGAAKLTIESGREPADLCRAVCSPAGSTIEGVNVLNGCSFADDVAAAIAASYKRTVELGK
jgi:pyrroline-5-carboxylate reductase